MKRLARLAGIAALLASTCFLVSCAKDADMEFKKFVDAHVAKLEPLEKAAALAYWEASTTGTEEAFKRYSELNFKREKLYTDAKEYAYVKGVKESGKLKDPQLARTADILFLRYRGNQIDSLLLKRMVDLAATSEGKFTTYRPVVGGKEITTNDVYTILAEEKNVGVRREAWEASKGVGPVVLGDLMELVKLRNEAARQIGYDNFYTMSLELAEQSEADLVRVFAELDSLTREPFLAMKGELDAELAKRFRVAIDDLRPWHYADPYFQELPPTAALDMDKYYSGKDVVEISKAFFAGLGLPVDDILARSDLFEKPGKNPHAFTTDIDRKGDIRVLANVKQNGYWMETMLHELGHGVYDKYVDPQLPFLLRSYPHLCTTEASAQIFGRLSQNPVWMKAALGLDDAEIARVAPAVQRSLRMKQLIFARWSQVMFHFERSMYKDPSQDLNTLWWDLVERYQFVKRPEGRSAPDFASKIHMVMSPVYYHNYLLGELIASQLQHYIMAEVLKTDGTIPDFYGKPEVGAYLRDVVYKPGDTMPWGKHVETVTGEPLTARYFVEQFVKE